MNEVVRSKKGLGNLFNVENRLRMGWPRSSFVLLEVDQSAEAIVVTG